MKLMTPGLNPLFKGPVFFFCSVALEHTPGAKWLDQLVFSCNKQKIQFEWTQAEKKKKKKEKEERFIVSVSGKSMGRVASGTA